jgi:hypothetical protein
MISPDTYYTCVAKNLSRLASESASLENVPEIFYDCARKFFDDVEPVLFHAFAGKEEPERIKETLNKLVSEKISWVNILGKDKRLAEIFRALVEAFFGGVDLSLLTIESVKWLVNGLSFLEETTGASFHKCKEIADEIIERLSYNIKVEPRKGGLYVVSIMRENLPWMIDYLWPLLTEIIVSERIEALLEDALRNIDSGRAILISGENGWGKHSFAFKLSEKLLSENYTLYYGSQNVAFKLSGKKVVFTPGKDFLFTPAGWDGASRQLVELEGVMTLEDAEKIASSRLKWDGVDDERLAHEIAKKSMGNPSYVDLASTYLGVCHVLGQNCEVLGDIDLLAEKLRKIVPGKVVDALRLPSMFKTRSFPVELIEEIDEESEAIIQRFLLKVPHLGLYSFRNSYVQRMFREKILVPSNIAEKVYSSEAPFIASWFFVSGLPGADKYLAFLALNNLHSENSVDILEAVSILSRGTVSSLLSNATLFRLHVLERHASSNYAMALAEELLELQLEILKKLYAIDPKYSEKILETSYRLAEARLSRFLPELALEAIGEVEKIGLEKNIQLETLRGTALIHLKDYTNAKKILGGILEKMSEAEDASYYSVKLAYLEAKIREKQDPDTLRELEEFVKLLSRGKCEYSNILLEAALLLKEYTQKKNYAVCMQLTRCGYPELAATYGCFE